MKKVTIIDSVRIFLFLIPFIFPFMTLSESEKLVFIDQEFKLSQALNNENITNSIENSFLCQVPLPKQKSQDLMQSVSNSYKGISAISALFLQESSMVALGESEKASGKVKFLKPGKMRWDYDPPNSQIFLVRDETVWLYQPELEQLIVDSLRSVLLADLPVAFLMGLGKLEDDFGIIEACKAGSNFLLRLLPKDIKKDQTGNQNTRSELSEFDLLVDLTSYLPTGARVKDVGGNTTSIRLLGVSSKVGLVSENDFVADFPTGIDVTDRRERMVNELNQTSTEFFEAIEVD